MSEQIASCMRYFETVYDKYISKMPVESAPDSKAKLHYTGENDQYNNRYHWKDKDVRKIMSMAKKGHTYDEISKLYGCSQPTISKLIKREREKQAAKKCTTTSSK